MALASCIDKQKQIDVFHLLSVKFEVLYVKYYFRNEVNWMMKAKTDQSNNI